MADEFDFDASDMDAQTEVEKSARVSDYIKLSEGTNALRILPKPPGAPTRNPFLQRFKHRIEFPGKQFPLQFECLRMLSGGNDACPGCEMSDKLRKTGTAVDNDRAFNISAKASYLVNAVDWKQQKLGPKVWEINVKLHDWLKKLLKDTENGGNFTHPVSGFAIVIEREGTGKNDTKYAQRAGKPMPLPNMGWIDEQHKLESFLTVKTYWEIRYALANKGEWGNESQVAEFTNDAGGTVSSLPRAAGQTQAQLPAGSRTVNVPPAAGSAAARQAAIAASARKPNPAPAASSTIQDLSTDDVGDMPGGGDEFGGQANQGNDDIPF